MEIGKIIAIVLLVLMGLCLLGMAFCVYMLHKNNNTFTNRFIIASAIDDYHTEIIDKLRKDIKTYGSFANYKIDSYLVDYDDMESYEKTMWRLWDWGYTRILPKDKFEIIKKYIKE
jgi:hypothetical protein